MAACEAVAGHGPAPHCAVRLFCLLILPALVCAAAPKFDTVLYGASYYHEYMPYDRLDKDIELMQKAGVTVVRLGESTWSSWEPEDGHFEFAWMDRTIDALHKAGIKVILGTPTYSIPPWLYHKHPEILMIRPGGQKATYGIRQNMDLTSPVFLYYAERIIRKVVAHYKDHPAIIGYQVDNETSSEGTSGPSVQADFVEYLKRRFGTTAAMNKAWGFVYWGQLVNDWSEMPPSDGMINPGYKLEWQRFQQKITTGYLAWQARIVNEYKRPDQFITHNFVGGVRTDVDQLEIAKSLDIAAVNPYHEVQDNLDGWFVALCGDLNRSLKHANYLITETNAQSIGWDSKTQFPPYDGQLRLNAYSHLASGANMVAYWHWSSLHYGQETYWKGVLGHDLEPNRVYNEMSRVGAEWKKLGPKLVNFQRKNDVAILYSIDSYHGLKFMPFDDKVDYLTVLYQMHKALYHLNAGTDFVFPGSSNFADYKVIVVPPLYVASDEVLKKLVDYVRNGGHLVMSFKSGFTNEFDTVRWSRMPGPLREAAGFSYQEFSTLRQPLALKGDPYHTGDANKVSVWAEFLMPETAKPIAYYDHPFFGRYSAITRNAFGKGTFTYEGTYLSDQLQEAVLRDVLKLAGLELPSLPKPVHVSNGTSATGSRMHYFLNYSEKPQSLQYTYPSGTDLLTGKPVGKTANVTLQPWDLAIIEEQ
jgi:beta-galactosidase